MQLFCQIIIAAWFVIHPRVTKQWTVSYKIKHSPTTGYKPAIEKYLIPHHFNAADLGVSTNLAFQFTSQQKSRISKTAKFQQEDIELNANQKKN